MITLSVYLYISLCILVFALGFTNIVLAIYISYEESDIDEYAIRVEMLEDVIDQLLIILNTQQDSELFLDEE